MIENPQHGYLYAINTSPDPLEYPPEQYLCCHTPSGQVRFLFSPDLHTSGPHEISEELAFTAEERGFELRRTDILSLWEDRDAAMLDVAKTYGLIATAPDPVRQAETILRATTAEGRIQQYLQDNRGWPNSTIHVHNSPTGTFQHATIVLRTNNPFQARALLYMLGAELPDVEEITGTKA
jgi:hypothetical protein